MPKKREKLSFKKTICVYTKDMTTKRAVEILEERNKKLEDEMRIYERFYKHYLQLEKRSKENMSWILYFRSHPDFFENDKYEEVKNDKQ